MYGMVQLACGCVCVCLHVRPSLHAALCGAGASISVPSSVQRVQERVRLAQLPSLKTGMHRRASQRAPEQPTYSLQEKSFSREACGCKDLCAFDQA